MVIPRHYPTNEIKEIINICGLLKEEYHEVEVHSFSNQLIELSTKALKHEKLIVAIGD